MCRSPWRRYIIISRYGVIRVHFSLSFIIPGGGPAHNTIRRHLVKPPCFQSRSSFGSDEFFAGITVMEPRIIKLMVIVPDQVQSARFDDLVRGIRAIISGSNGTGFIEAVHNSGQFGCYAQRAGIALLRYLIAYAPDD